MKRISIALVLAFLLLLPGLLILAKASRADISVRDDDPSSDGLIGKKAPDLSDGRWINSSPLNLSKLGGTVVLLEFWTYGCYNCRNTLPQMNEWREKFAARDLAIIGVHTPEFDKEKNFLNVQKETARLGIRYAVVTDNESQTWDRYGQRYWPTMYLIDKKGFIRHIQIGEGNYDGTEQMIRTLIAEK